MQLIGRLWRRPQPKRVVVYRLLAQDSPDECLTNYIYKSYMGYRPGGVTGRVAGTKWQGQNEFHVEEPTKAII